MQIENEILEVIADRFSKAFDRLAHGINQLNEQQVWYRPTKNSNSIGIIIKHLDGNLNQWILSAVGGEEYHRNREKEFKDESRLSKKDILIKIDSLKKQTEEVIAKIPSGTLLLERRIQGFDETVMSALIIALTHLELHAGQVLYVAKLLLGEYYKESWEPANAEQGGR